VLYVLWVKIWHKPIGEKMNRWYDKNAVQVRDQAANSLDAENISHFPNPKSGDTSLTPLQKNQRVDTSGEPLGAAATYRTDHREAMRMAYEHGRKREKMEDALLADSFACHFLTDSFSAGHIRTPRASIKEYWNNLVPDFQEKLIHWLAAAINREHWGVKRPGAYLKGGSVEEQSTLKLEILLSPREHLSFGNVASLIVHDVEGDQGVDATIGSQKISLVGDKGLLQGDKDDKFDTAASFQPTAQGQATFNAAVEAVKASFDDLWKAYDTGWKNEPLSSTDEMIRGKDGLYPAERLLPEPVPDSQLPKSKQSFSWQQKSVADFLNTHKQGLVQWGQAEAITFQKKLDEIKDLPPEAKNAIRRSLLAPLSSGKSQAIADVILNVIGQR
jgi:hypothetical protein